LTPVAPAVHCIHDASQIIQIHDWKSERVVSEFPVNLEVPKMNFLRSQSRSVFFHALMLAAVVVCGVALGQGTTGVQSVYNAYWSTAGGFQSLAQLHNNSVKSTLTVLPTIYIPGGQSFQLDSVALVPLGNATIDIGAELTAKGWGQSTTGSAVFQYQGAPGSFEVEVYEGDAAKSLSFTIPSTDKPYASGSV
jgi:hypothetical protein